MRKRFLFLLLALPLLVYCGDKDPIPADDPGTEQPGPDGPDEPDGPDNPTPAEDPTVYDNAAPEVKDGDEVLACSPLVEKFLTEVSYPDKDLSFTKIFDYYGGFDGKNLFWSNWQKEWPNGDQPEKYSIRWKQADLEEGVMNLHLEDQTGWKGDVEVAEGACYVDISNLVPNQKYSYQVTAASGKVLALGEFTTTGHLHQCFFRGNKKGTIGVHNCRDLGGWKTLDGKTVKYHKVYRGGRLNDRWEAMMNSAGRKELLLEGIGAQLELRGSDDYMSTPAEKTLDFCAPVIEEGGKVMLGVTKPSAKNCAKWLKFDQGREDIADVSSYTPTNEEFAAFQEAYKAKTKECFEFVLNSVRANKGVYFHCSLGRDRTGTMAVILLGVLGVREGDISQEFELTYFAPVGYSVSSSDKENNPEPIFKNTRMQWVYSEIQPYFWSLATDGTFASGVENCLVNIAGVPQKDVDEFRSLMLQ